MEKNIPNLFNLLFVMGLLKVTQLQVKWSGVRTQHSTTPFVDEMYDRLKETLSDYEIIICRWPEYTFVLEQVCKYGLISLFFYLFSFFGFYAFVWSFICTCDSDTFVTLLLLLLVFPFVTLPNTKYLTSFNHYAL